jgi:anti-sigma regulatory factor (Ser/Thr protein kinase)
MNTTLSLPVHEKSQAGAARRAVAEWASGRGWSEEMLGRLALVVTELGRNLASHGTTGGSLLLRTIARRPGGGVEILSLDSGPGMASFQECLRDGYSTAGTPGTGLGAVKRASQYFGVHSQIGVGTALVCEIWGEPRARSGENAWEVGGVNVPVPPEIVCGDAWTVLSPSPGVLRVLVADGLGHGVLAAAAAGRAVEIFSENPSRNLEEILERIHEGLRSTRGAAVALAEIDTARREVHYIGLGNIGGVIFSDDGKSVSMVSANGTAGGQRASARLMMYPWPAGATLVMASDGVKHHWNLERYAGLAHRHPSLLAGVLYRDYVRGKDDATVVAVKGAE